MPDVVPAAVDIPPRPGPAPHRGGAGDPIVRSWRASRVALGRAATRRCREATRRPAPDHACRASPRDDARAHTGRSGAAARDRSRAETSPPPECGPRGRCPDEDRCRSLRPSAATDRPAARAIARARRGGGSGGAFRLAIQCERPGRPSVRRESEDRRSAEPREQAGRSSELKHQVRASRRPLGRRSRLYRDRARKVRPQGDHLLASGCCAIAMIIRADRRAASTDAPTRLADGLAECQMLRKSALRRSHSQANPRASSPERAW